MAKTSRSAAAASKASNTSKASKVSKGSSKASSKTSSKVSKASKGNSKASKGSSKGSKTSRSKATKRSVPRGPASPKEDLPQDLWTLILQHIPYQQRLSDCALVCRKLRQAAAAATQRLELELEEEDDMTSFLEWTNRHGSSLTSLSLELPEDALYLWDGEYDVRQLQCQNLVELELIKTGVQLGPYEVFGYGTGLLQSCTALTRLVVLEPVLLDRMPKKASAAVPPATVAQLKHFELRMELGQCGDEAFVEDWEERDNLGDALEAWVAPHLTSLTHLTLGGVPETCNPHISNILGLQELKLGGRGAAPITPDTLPGIERLTVLKSLALFDCVLESSCMLSVTANLTSLNLKGVVLEPLHGKRERELGSLQLLLQAVARLPALQELSLESITGKQPQQLSAYSALTASSELRELCLTHLKVPTAAWVHVFPAGRRLPHLHSLKAKRQQGPIDSAGIASLVSCCPGLVTLSVTTCDGASLDPLDSLTALTNLNV